MDRNTAADFATIKNNLIDKRDELEERISGIKKDFKKGRSPDSEDRATESENDEVLNELKDEAENELVLVQLSLQRLNDGSYGICTECESEISPQRLSILPHTKTCIACAE